MAKSRKKKSRKKGAKRGVVKKKRTATRAKNTVSSRISKIRKSAPRRKKTATKKIGSKRTSAKKTSEKTTKKKIAAAPKSRKRKPIVAKTLEPTAGALKKRDRLRIDRAFQKLLKSIEATGAASRDFLSVIDQIERAAVAKSEDEFVADLLEDKLLDHLLELHCVLAAIPKDQLPEALRAYKIVPEAWLLRMERQFDIHHIEESGAIMEISADRIPNQDADSTKTGLVKVRVITVGWRRGRTTLIEPVYEVLDERMA